MWRKEAIMKPRSFIYNLRQGFKNIWRNRMFSLASIATMAACILIFGVFFSILMNVNYMIRTLEEEVGIRLYQVLQKGCHCLYRHCCVLMLSFALNAKVRNSVVITKKMGDFF